MTLILGIFLLIGCALAVLIGLSPIIIPLAFLFGVFKGMVLYIKDRRPEQLEHDEDWQWIDELQKQDNQYYMILPEDRETIKALEYSADAAQQEIDYYTSQLEMAEDEADKIKYRKKIAAAKKRIAADNKKINKIRNTYLID